MGKVEKKSVLNGHKSQVYSYILCELNKGFREFLVVSFH